MTAEQWYQQLRAWVPGWWFEDEHYNVAVFRAMGEVMAQVEEDSIDQFNATFLTRSTAPILDLAGSERNQTRLSGESDASYANRIQRLSSASDWPEIKAAVDSVLLVPGCKILEAPGGKPYGTRKSFISRDEYFCSFREDMATVVVPKQIHAPYSFASRGNYASRGSFMGSATSSTQTYSTLVNVINALKAFGVLFRIVESTRSPVY